MENREEGRERSEARSKLYYSSKAVLTSTSLKMNPKQEICDMSPTCLASILGCKSIEQSQSGDIFEHMSTSLSPHHVQVMPLSSPKV